MWHFESQGGSICVAFCDAIPLSANTVLHTICDFIVSLHNLGNELCNVARVSIRVRVI